MRKLLLPVLFLLLTIACKKSSTTNSPANGFFQIEIKATSNIDCNLPEIAFLTGKNEAYNILGDKRGTYIGIGLPKVLYPPGTKLTVRIRKPNATESIPCTQIGIAWSHAMITEVQ